MGQGVINNNLYGSGLFLKSFHVVLYSFCIILCIFINMLQNMHAVTLILIETGKWGKKKSIVCSVFCSFSDAFCNFLCTASLISQLIQDFSTFCNVHDNC